MVASSCVDALRVVFLLARVTGVPAIAAVLSLLAQPAAATTGQMAVSSAGADISVSVDEPIITAGADTDGLDLRSHGSPGPGGGVSAAVNANITASGPRSNGVLLQSVGGGGGGPLALTVAPGVTVSGGSAMGAGVRLVGGGANTLVNRGVIASAQGIDGFAIVGGQGDDRVENFGLIQGAIDLGPGSNALNNRPGGQIHSGAWITIGAGAQFLNEGVLSPGGPGRVQLTGLTGDYVQSAAGALDVDLDLAQSGSGGEADRLAATGSASVGGVVQVSLLNKGLARTGPQAVTILSAAGGANMAGLTLSAPTSAVASFGLTQPDPNTIQLSYVINFFPTGLNANQSSVGDAFNKLFKGSAPAGLEPVAATLIDAPTVAALGKLYDRFSPEPYVHQVGASQASGLAFADRLFSCVPAAGQSIVDPGAACLWMTLEGRVLTRDQTAQTQRFREEAVSVSGGVETGVGRRWRLGAALSYESADSRLDHARSSGGRVQGGVVVKRDQDWAELALAVTGGHGRFHVDRTLDMPVGATAYGTQDVSFGVVSARVSRRFGSARRWVRPSLEVAGTLVHTDAVNEAGGGPLSLAIAPRAQTSWRFRPAVEVGADIPLRGGMSLRPTARLGLDQVLSGQGSALDAGFSGAPAGLATLVAANWVDRTTGEAWLGLALVNRSGVSARLSYLRQFGSTTLQQGGQLKVVLPF